MIYNYFFEILPHSLQECCARLPLDRVYEVRLRAGSPVIVCIAGRSFYLNSDGFASEVNGAVTVSCADLETIVHKASNYSVYSASEQIARSFITIRGGIRIGICGEVVMDSGRVTTIKNVSSLNIRIPHQVRNCSYPVLPYIFGKGAPYKTLIISKPGAGKTTFLRDIARQISDTYKFLNTLIIDERAEIGAMYLGERQLDVGVCSDVITGSSKTYAFECGIRSMRPDVVITDEIATREDIDMIKLSARSGVCIIASVHASGIDEVRNKPFFREIIEEGIFERYVVLAVKDSAGVVTGVYDRNMKLLAL